MSKKDKQLEEYYSNYYNEKYTRDVFYFRPNSYIISKRNKDYHENNDNLSDFLSFLVNTSKNKELGLIASRVGYYTSLEDYKQYDVKQIYSDRLFFDFDVDDMRLKSLKEQINVENKKRGRERSKEKLNSLYTDYKNLIIDENILKKPFDEAKALCAYLESMDLRPYLIFSGSKGFHCNIFFPETHLTQIKQISKRLSNHFSNKLKLECLDPAVYTTRTPLQRVQYTKNEKTGLYCVPLPSDITYDETLDIINKNDNSPINFSIGEYYAHNDFHNMLLSLNEKIIIQDQEKQKRIKINNIKRRISKGICHDNILEDVDMRILARKVIGEREDPEYSNIYHCPFHLPDNHPSGVAFEDNYWCSTCNQLWGPYDFLADIFDLKTKQEVMQKFNQVYK